MNDDSSLDLFGLSVTEISGKNTELLQLFSGELLDEREDSI